MELNALFTGLVTAEGYFSDFFYSLLTFNSLKEFVYMTRP
jgi:hypothetical protein